MANSGNLSLTDELREFVDCNSIDGSEYSQTSILRRNCATGIANPVAPFVARVGLSDIGREAAWERYGQPASPDATPLPLTGCHSSYGRASPSA